VTVVQNSARGKQLTAGRSLRFPTLLVAQPKSKSLIANDNPTRIVILSDQRESKGLSSQSLPLEASPSSLPWLLSLLIASLELEFRASARKKTTALKSNRKYSQLLRSPWRIAISCSEERWSPTSLDTRHSSLSTGFLIETPRLKFRVTSRKQSALQFSNRDKMRVLQTAFMSDPLSSAPNLAIIFPTRGHL
jgi:hypothetical protein